jgi:4'-phosphopantetheinyl transferase
MQGPINSKTPLPAAEVHVWLCELSVPESTFSRLETLLSPAERNRASRFSRATDGERFIASHGILRVILGRYLEMESDALRFAAGSEER